MATKKIQGTSTHDGASGIINAANTKPQVGVSGLTGANQSGTKPKPNNTSGTNNDGK